MEVSQAIKELKEYVKVDKEHRAVNSYNSDFDKFCDNHIESIEIVLKRLEHLKEENEHLRDLYLRTAKKLDENGKEELADYFLAQIGAVPTLSPQ